MVSVLAFLEITFTNHEVPKCLSISPRAFFYVLSIFNSFNHNFGFGICISWLHFNKSTCEVVQLETRISPG